MSGAGRRIPLVDDAANGHHAFKRAFEPMDDGLSNQSTGAVGPELTTLRETASLAQIPNVMILALGRTFGAESPWPAETCSVAADRCVDRPFKARLLPMGVCGVLEVED